MKTLGAITVAGLVLLASQLACCSITLPNVEVDAPVLEVGEMRETTERIDLGEQESVTARITFAAGELTVEAGEGDDLFAGRFRTNVAEWEPEVTFEDGVLAVTQGDAGIDWGVPTGNAHNEWDLEFSPDVPISVTIDAGAGDGDFDLTGLRIAMLDVDLGAGDFEVRFDEPNRADMDRLTLDVGAAKLEMDGIGNAGPRRARIQGGVGDIDLDFAGAWSRSADVEVTAGLGAVTLRLPDDVGVRVEVEGGLSSVETSGLRRSGGAYVNGLYGETEIELNVTVTTGLGQVTLIEVAND